MLENPSAGADARAGAALILRPTLDDEHLERLTREL